MGVNGISIFLLVRSLEVGGAERQLVGLATGLHDRGHKVRVAVFYRRGALAAELERRGIEIVDLRKNGRWDIVRFLIRTVRALRRAKPDVLYSFLGGANIVAAAIRPFAPQLRLVWSIRASDMDLTRYDWLHRVAYLFECRLSRMPDLIIANSSSGRDFAVRNGFPAGRISIVRNGIDTERFRPNPALRKHQRRVWNIADDEIAVSVLARLDPMKGHATFLRAASIAAKERRDLRFFCIGEGSLETPLKALADKLGIADKLKFTVAADPVAALNAIDIACSSSTFGEGFSNSIAEAMSCGRPCVVTRVGDSAAIVGDRTVIVPPGDPEALAAAIVGMAARLDTIDSSELRSRIVQKFSLANMVDRTVQLLGAAVSGDVPYDL